MDNSCTSQFGGKKKSHTHPLDRGRRFAAGEHSSGTLVPLQHLRVYIFMPGTHCYITGSDGTFPLYEARLFLHTSVTQYEGV